jgi:peptidoglycan/xylan/chitin deacetylase (PgdA/CDA1 family)
MTIASRILSKIDEIEYRLLPRSYFQDKVYVLLYHSIAEEKHCLLENMSDSIFLPVETFRKQIQFIRDNYEIVSIEDYIDGQAKKQSVIINFDDGYKDVFQYAYPILEEYEAPFSISINSSFSNCENLFWISKINYLRENSLYQEFICKHDVSEEISKLCNNLVLDEQLCSFFDEKELDMGEIIKQSELYLDKNDIKQMSPELLSILPHTHNHYKTVDLTHEQRKEEIEKSINYCAEVFPEYYQPVFSFPFGSPGLTFDEVDIDILAENDIKYYLSAENGINDLHCNCFEIKRKSVYCDQSLDSFRYFIEKPQIISQKARSMFGRKN